MAQVLTVEEGWEVASRGAEWGVFVHAVMRAPSPAVHATIIPGTVVVGTWLPPCTLAAQDLAQACLGPCLTAAQLTLAL
jgi:hypothetical protein